MVTHNRGKLKTTRMSLRGRTHRMSPIQTMGCALATERDEARLLLQGDTPRALRSAGQADTEGHTDTGLRSHRPSGRAASRDTAHWASGRRRQRAAGAPSGGCTMLTEVVLTLTRFSEDHTPLNRHFTRLNCTVHELNLSKAVIKTVFKNIQLPHKGMLYYKLKMSTLDH